MAEHPADPQVGFDEIRETFDLLDDWEERYRYVIDLGKALPGLPEALKSAETKVDGCASQVWLTTQIRPGEDGAPRFYFEGDSDAFIVRGLIAVLKALLSGKPAAEVAASDPVADFAALGFDAHLSAQRSNGLRAMIARLKQRAEEKS